MRADDMLFSFFVSWTTVSLATERHERGRFSGRCSDPSTPTQVGTVGRTGAGAHVRSFGELVGCWAVAGVVLPAVTWGRSGDSLAPSPCFSLGPRVCPRCSGCLTRIL